MGKPSRFAFTARALGSPFSSVVLATTLATLATVSYTAAAANRAPQVSGYPWPQHPDVLVVVAPTGDSCDSCHLSTTDWASAGLKKGLEVLVLAQRDSAEIKALRQRFRKQKVTVSTSVAPEVLSRWSSSDKPGVVRVREGWIVARQQGGLPTLALLGKGGVE